MVVISISEVKIAKAAPKTIVVPDNFSTIQDAIDNAVEGDTIFVKTGVYDEILQIEKSLSLVGENQETTIINGHNRGPVVYIHKDEVNISNFTILNGDTPASKSSSAQYFPYSTRLAGVHVSSAGHCFVMNNKIMNSGCGIWLYDSVNNQIVGNDIINNSNGVKIQSSARNIIGDNYILNSWAGISFSSTSSKDNILRTNNLVNNSASLYFSSIFLYSSFDNDIDESNTINGKPIIFWIDRHNSNVPSNAGDVILVNCTAITVNYSDPNYKLGIIFFNTNSSSISNTNSNINLLNSYDNSIADNTFSLSMQSSSRNAVIRNIGSISLRDAHNNSIIGNSGWIELHACSFNTIEGNNCSGQGGNGIYISGTCISNSVIRNEVSNNEQSGIKLYSGSGKYYPIIVVLFGYITIYDNNFINNTQDIIRAVASSLKLHNGYPGGGNYWSNYQGHDNFSGVQQDEYGADGIGDMDFAVSDLIIDYYPFSAEIKFFDVELTESPNYWVKISSDMLVTNLSFNSESKSLAFNVDSKIGTLGTCRVTIPKDLLYAEGNWIVYVNGNPTTAKVWDDTYNSYLYFSLANTAQTVDIVGTAAIPEFPSWAIFCFTLVGSLTIVLFKKKVWRQIT
ncbi:MAG: NosD domain-containing protein [Candidatus Bathyarchaeota archaeon]